MAWRHACLAYLNQHISDTEAALIPTAPIVPSMSANT